MRLLLLAPPGAGKGTQADRLSAHFGIPHISTGDLFRSHVAAQDELGRSVQGYLDAGDLVPDDVVLDMVRGAVERALAEHGGYLLDGFPRTVAQARLGAHVARQLRAPADAVLHYEVGEPELIRRLLERGDRERRSDDIPTAIRHRLDVYRTQTAPLLDYYRQRGVLVTVNAERPVDDVTAASLAALEPFVRASPAQAAD